MHLVNKRIGVYAEFTYPSVPPDQQAVIYQCAYAAGVEALPTIEGAVATCATTGPICVATVTAAVGVANGILRDVFFKCIREASGLPTHVKRQCNIGITWQHE
ncbi:hypothetical protein [Bacillus cereus]|uniref:hypothetical protein n=1 Tax=Bacillus cereus TaxID=1396 RepID=UPI001145F06B|nr:hypothetical protein [Bacillus cereus]